MITILDGAMGTELAARGASTGKKLWSAQALIDAPDAVLAVHRDHIAAGSDVITTNTYSTIPSYLSKAGEEKRYLELTDLAGQIARRAADAAGRAVRVAGSLPPLSESYRADLVPVPEISGPVYSAMAEALVPHVDQLICETMSSATEARTAAEAALEQAHARQLPVYVSWTLKEDPGKGLRSGETIADAFAAVCDLDLAGFLFNCTHPEAIEAGLVELRELTDRPLGAYANRLNRIAEGWTLDNDIETGPREDLDQVAFLASARRCVEAGATMVGGCCGIPPDFIEALAADLRTLGNDSTRVR